MNISTKELDLIHYTAAAIKVLHYTFQPYAICFRMHWHDRMEFLYIRRGEITIDYGTTTFTASSGSLVIIPPKMSHKGYTQTKEVDYDVLMFDVRSFYNETEICKRILPALYDGRARLKPSSSDTDTIQAFEKICTCHQTESLVMTTRIYHFLSLLYENNLLHLLEHQGNTTVNEIIGYIEQKFDQNITSTLLSNRFGYSETHLARRFKSVTGLSPIMYLNIFRLEQAYLKIKHTTLTIGEIAAQCGFSDTNYFTRTFKKHFGFPPTYYRKHKS